MKNNKKQKFVLFLIVIVIIIVVIWLIKDFSSGTEIEYNLPKEVKEAGEVQVKVNPEPIFPIKEEVKIEEIEEMLNQL